MGPPLVGSEYLRLHPPPARDLTLGTTWGFESIRTLPRLAKVIVTGSPQRGKISTVLSWQMRTLVSSAPATSGRTSSSSRPSVGNGTR